MATAALAACAGDVRTQHGYQSASTASLYAYGAARRDLKVVVLGNPFAMPQETVDAAVVQALHAGHIGAPTTFTTRPGPSAREEYRIVLLFDPPVGFHGPRLCGPVAALSSGPSSSGRLGVHAAFCRAGDVLTESWGNVARPASPADSGFERLIEQLAIGLLPRRERVDRERN